MAAGTYGIAYGATLLSIRADKDACAFDPAVLARAIDYAIDDHARIIGMPFASKKRIPAIEPALERAVTPGVMIVAAAGDDGTEQPNGRARYASDPRFSRSTIVVGASTRRGTLARWLVEQGRDSGRLLSGGRWASWSWSTAARRDAGFPRARPIRRPTPQARSRYY